MSTEQQSQTPPPPPPPVREPGASPTAAAAATDKRPRGRPRKDGASPFQRVRKKPRNRGKPTVEDEDSMDGLEATETENTVEVADTREQFTEEDAQSEVDDDKKPTPDLQCSVSVDSANTNCSIGVEAKSSSEQVCAFCYCGERSSLGQGELKQFSPTPGFIAPWNNQPLNINETVDSNDTIDESMPRQNPVLHKARGQKKEQNITTCTCISIEATPDDQVVKVWDELRMVGLPDDIDIQALFEPTGYCWAHHRCAEWSLEVCQTEEQLPANVDKAVVSGSTKRCAYCKHLGATIKCCEEKCTHIYHYPCAAGAGTFQDFNNFSLLCPDHIDQAPQRSKEEANCAVCDSPGDLLDQLFCTTCGQHYHGMCLDIQVTPIKRAGWQCPDCKVCQNCKQSGEDNKMLVCDTCDKGYHTFCLQPVMDSVPTNGWKCKNCRICAECGTRISSQWHHNCLMCDSCYRQQDNLPCPFCEKSPYPNLQKERLHCHVCKRWIHIGCDKPPDNELDIHLKEYICSLCKHSDADQEHTQMYEMMETEQLLPEVNTEIENIDSEDIGNQKPLVPEGGLDQELVVESSTDNALSLTAQEHICLSLDEKKYELETQVSSHFDTEEGEMSVKNTPAFDNNPSDKKRETPENIPEITQQESDKQAEETKPSETSTKLVEVPQEECQLLQREPENISKTPETFILVGKEPVSSPKEEQSETVAVLASANGRDTPKVSPLPQSESCATESCQLADKPTSESLPEMFSPRPSSVEISKPVDGSSLTTSSLEPSASHEMLRCQMSSLESAAVLPTTFVSLTPKIGMGKPAITKRKFSPGRPRSRQGTWNSHNTASPPSWSQDILEGREAFKSRQLPGSAIWNIKVGRGSGFPGKRRPRGAGLSGRGGRGRSKLKNGVGSILATGATDMDNLSNKDEEENSMHNTVVLFSSSDKFTLYQDMCVVCGSFGQGAEGQLLACSQCGQCYHPFCVGIKITKVVLHKGWRCLECTVCEACGKATDPGRLLLCDDCDISYHTYCLDPPLQTVPKGGWKCKWCVWCRHCGATFPGLRCEWQNNYTQCAPCASLSTCPVCCCNYREEELILQCRQCDRWMHTVCQNLNTEEEVENTADNGFDCTMCRPYMPSANVPSFEFCESSIATQIPLKAKELDPPKTYTQDGVCLTETGMSQLQSLSAIVPRRKRAKPKLKLKIINQNSVAVLQTPPDVQSEHSRDGEMDDSREGDLMDCEGKSDTSPEREPIDDDPKGMEATEGIKKRKRKPYRPGIGGFMVRQRSRTGQGKMKRSLSRKDSSGSVSEQILSRDESWSEQLPDTLVDETMSVSENMEKMKKRYRKKKNKLEEIFPAYLQEAFFGKELLDTSRQSKPRLDNLCDRSLSISCKASLNTNFLDPSSDPLLSSTCTSTPPKSGAQGTLDDPLAALVLNTEDDILGILSDDLVKPGDHSGLDLCTFQVENSSSPFAGLDIGPISDDPSTSLPLQNVSQSTRPLSEEQLDGILSPELDKMVTDGAILGKLYKIPELGGKDVEDLFTAVLSPVATQSVPLPQPPPPPPPQIMHLHNQGENAFSRIPLMNGLIGQTPHLPHTPLVPGSGLGTFSTITQPSYTDTRDKNTVFNAVINDPTNPWVATATPLEGENDTMSNAQRSTLKWEKEEALGEMATVAPVLYTNINFPNLKEEFPDWTTRVKQIAKLWRKASSQERAPYVQKARDNRAALRINKVQMSNDSMKRQQQQDNIDPGSRIETDLFKDPLKQRESEHEQEWKFRQQMRQKSKQQAKIEATQKLEQVKNEQQQQQQLQQQQLGSQQLVSQSGSDTPSSGMQSPLTPQTSNGNMSPAQQALYAKQLPGPSTATPPDVFLKPQAPPPPVTANRMPVQDGHCQTPSQQTFSSSPSAQPPSPVDPYAKMVGTPRPPPVNQNQKFVRRNSATSAEVCPLPSISRPTQVSESMGRRPSPARDSCSLSPGTSDPYAKPPDTPRPVIGTEQFSKPLGMSRSPLISEQPASSDQFAKPSPRIGGDTFQRPRISSTDSCLRPSLTSASVIEGHPSPFKTPVCPNPSSQDSYTKMPPTLRRVAVDPYERPLLTPRPVDNFAHNPSNDSYSQTQLASHSAIKDTFAHPQRVLRNQGDYSGALSRTVAQDPYAQPPSTPRPVTDPYAQPPGTPRPVSDLYAKPPGTPRPVSVDPYMHQPLASRPPQAADLFAQVSANQRHSDLYAQPPGTPIPVTNDPYSQSPATQRSGISETFSRPIPMSNRDPYLQASQNRTLSGTFVKPSDPSQPSKLSGSTDSFSHDPSPCDPFDQPPMTPRSQPETFGTAQHSQEDQSRSGSEGNFSSSVNSSMNLQGKLFSQTTQGSVPGPTAGLTQNSAMSHTDAEKLRQRQKLREIILQQQQQKKNAIRQEKASPEPTAATPTAPIQPWQQENLNQIFTRPPPPYPGNIRSSTIPPGGLRLAGFPVDGQLNRPQFPGDAVGMGMRPHGIRFGFPSGGHGPLPCQDHFLGPPQQMQHAGVLPQFRRSMPIDLPRLPNKPPMNNPIGLSQHFSPQGIQVQQHNIMGQAFIELCHRAPEVRPRLPFISSSTIMNTVPEHQQQTELLPRQDRPGPRHLEPTRCNSQNSDNPLQSSTGLEHLAPSQQDKMNPAHPPALVMCSLNHPSINNAFSGDSLPTTRPTDETNDLQVSNQPTDTLEEKLDPDDPSVKDLDVKDLDSVEVKDLVDEDLENLNLDAEDKGDELDTLDNLETNDRHLDDLLRSGEFDIIAYTDPDHDLGDKKGMFSEELDLNVPIDDIQGKAEDSLQKHSDDKTSAPEVSVPPQKKATENSETKTEVLSPVEEATCNHEKIDKNVAASSSQHDGETKSVLPCNMEATDKANMNEETTASSSDAVQISSQNTTNSCNTPGSTPVLTSLLAHGNSENPDTKLLDSPSHSFRTTQTNPISSISQTLITSTSQNMENVLPDVNMVPPVSHSFSQGTVVNSGFISGQPLNPSLGVGQLGSQTGPVVNRPVPSGIPGPQQLVLSQTLVQQQNRERPLLLEEQPLLLQDLLDQERQEQQQQRQMQAMIRQRSEPFFPNIDFDAITDPIMKAKMVALKGINKVMAQNNMGMPPLVMNRFALMGQTGPGAQSSEGQHLIPQAVTQDGSLTPQMSRPNPPNFGPGFVNDSYRKQYEEWLQETQQLLQMQQKYLEEQIGAHRKSKKALSAKQRTAKKAGREFPEEDAEQLKHVTEQQSMVQKQLEQPLGNPLQGSLSCGNSQVQRTDLGHEMKKQRNKRTQRTGEKATSRPKRKKKEEEEKQTVFPNTETFMQLKQQLSLLPLMEPMIGMSFAHFLPYGSGHQSSGSRLVGAFGSATLDGVSDYYSQLIYKQNNLSNPPTPPASLPPTPPPVTGQKIVNGFATTEELATKAGMLGGPDALGSKQFQLPFRPQDDLLARAIIQGPKSVDVPASLPTPPHNNHEELRIQDPCDDRESPDSFVPSSSPESVLGMEISRYPDLSAVKEEMPQSIPSPVIPILPASTGKGSEAKQNFIKIEPCSTFFSSQLGLAPNNTESGLVSIAITLHPTAAEVKNIGSVVAAFSNLLHVRIPNSYEISTASDVPSSIGIMNPHRTNPAFEYRQHVLLHGPQSGTFGPPGLTGPYGLKPHNAPFLSSGNVLAGYKAQSPNIADGLALRSQWCSHCKVVVLGSGVRKSFKELHFLKQDSKEKSERIEKDIVFCSNNCLVLYSASMQAKNSESKESVPPEIQFPMKEPPKGFHQYNTNISTFDVHCLPQLQEKNSPPSSPLIIFPPAFEAAKVEPKPEELKVTVKLKPRLRTVPNGLDDCRPVNKKWKGMKWKKWNVQIVIPKGTFKPTCEEEIDELLKKLGTTLKPDPLLKDYRKCCFCHEEGDGLTDGPARLLNLDLDLWVHLNCALWSTEVYETQAGALINVELALRRGLQMKCVFCHKMGATSGCHRLRCTNVYHFTCAIKAQCMFFKDKTMLCPMHKPKSTHEQELSYFAVFRRVYVQRDEVRQIASIVQRGDREHTFRVGSLIFHSIGQLLPHQMVAFHSSKVLYPVGFEASRLYWSIRYTNRRSRYLCSIEEKDGFPLFVIRVIEQGHEDMILTGLTPEDVWDKILEPVAAIRKTSEMLQLFPIYLKGEDLFGLTVSAVARIAESLPGVEACERYTFRYGRNPLMELPLAINPTGCARSEPKMSSHVKRFVLRPHTLNSTSTSKSFQSTVTGELNAPYSKQFVHSKSSQYRKMKTEWKSNVYLARSRIQGLGLYAARDIEKHTMVIEYIGTIIRNEVANRKEKLYESQNRGVYMFRIDNDHVIDATLTGGPARYINHSCAPNCVAEVVTFERGHKIIISSNRRIQKGEELCYDYKFDFEDDQHKIACHCGAVNCRKWMN
ncbi:histone-lysine N-methyltransferase 2C isoform X18 [Ahaetulla prasina]|uniref:histone-lysine N-methyltransferase 2C isoform X18 n=1 Tax=Ahaetulla prasina TaxID=499056 RepID=UPI0026472897|nr:histone-lysine N-methyltransferase 2C isoform X18 [Ahaetulla prasina]